MKPAKWYKWDTAERKRYALELLSSARGKYLMSQALHYAVKSLKQVQPEVMQERSNIEDMEVLQEIYNIPIAEPEEIKRLMKQSNK